MAVNMHRHLDYTCGSNSFKPETSHVTVPEVLEQSLQFVINEQKIHIVNTPSYKKLQASLNLINLTKDKIAATNFAVASGDQLKCEVLLLQKDYDREAAS